MAVFTPEVSVVERRNHAVDRQHAANGIAAFGPNQLVGMAAFAFSVPLRHAYAMFWRAGLMEIVE